MKKILLYLSLIFVAGIIVIPVVFSDNDHRWDNYRQRSIGVATLDNTQYQEECGSCHMAYQPGLLASQSWEKIITNLADHFGDNAELEKDVQLSISEYLLTNSAENSDYRRSRKFIRNINLNDAPIRITQTPYFIHKHNEIPDRIVKNNPQVVSFSNCNACHIKAEQGLFGEDNVRIPGFGRWDD
jgi:Dihaem cytochrome c